MYYVSYEDHNTHPVKPLFLRYDPDYCKSGEAIVKFFKTKNLVIEFMFEKLVGSIRVFYSATFRELLAKEKKFVNLYTDVFYVTNEKDCEDYPFEVPVFLRNDITLKTKKLLIEAYKQYHKGFYQEVKWGKVETEK